MCERDHLLVDYHNRFIPTLSDFVQAIDDDAVGTTFRKKLDWFHSDIVKNAEVSELLLSPLSCTGKLKSLLITHNSWFINTVVTRIFNTQPLLIDFPIVPADVFNVMKFALWMDNGIAYPESATMLKNKLIER